MTIEVDGLVCPRCSGALRHRVVGTAGAWCCDACSGMALNLAVFRAQIDERVATAFWKLACAAKSSVHACPSCRRSLGQIDYAHAGGSVEVDVCTGCQLIWFDQGELERFAAGRPRPATKPQLRSRPSATSAQAFTGSDIRDAIATEAVADVLSIILAFLT